MLDTAPTVAIQVYLTVPVRVEVLYVPAEVAIVVNGASVSVTAPFEAVGVRVTKVASLY